MASKTKTTAELERAKEALTELRRRKEPLLRLRQLVGQHPKQDEFVLSQEQYRTASAGRRGGKSGGVARILIEGGLLFPRETMLYVVQSRETAKGIIWPALRKISEQIGLDLEFKEHTGDVVFPNGAKIILRGGGTIREIEKYRGIAYPRICVDEAQLFGPSLRYLYSEVAGPAMMDFGTKAKMTLTGTPNAACAGPFREMITGGTKHFPQPIGPHFSWIATDNPFLSQPELYLERKRREMGPNSLAFRREYLGQWVREDGALVFRLRRELNTCETFDRSTADDWEYTLGIDLGYNDPSAFVVLATSPSTAQCVVVESYEEHGMLAPAVAATVEGYMEEYEEFGGFKSIVGDSAGYGKSIVESLNQEYGIGCKAAKKRDKAAQIEMMNGSLSNGTMKIAQDRNPDLFEQMEVLQWDPEELENNKFVALDARQKDHLADALVYAYRDAHPHTDDREHNPPKPGTEAWYDAIDERIVEGRVKKLTSEKEWFD